MNRKGLDLNKKPLRRGGRDEAGGVGHQALDKTPTLDKEGRSDRRRQRVEGRHSSLFWEGRSVGGFISR